VTPIRFVRIEVDDRLFLSRPVPCFLGRSHGAFRALARQRIEVQEEAETCLVVRGPRSSADRRGNVIRLEIDGQMPTRLQRFVVQEPSSATMRVHQEGMLGLADTRQLSCRSAPNLVFKALQYPLPSRESKRHCLRPSHWVGHGLAQQLHHHVEGLVGVNAPRCLSDGRKSSRPIDSRNAPKSGY